MADTYRIDIGGGVNQAVFSSLDRFRNSLTGASGILSGLGSKIAVAFGGYQLVHFAKQSIDAADELGKFSQEVGIGVEQLSKLKYSADLADVGDQFRQGMFKFSQSVSDAADDSSRAAKVFAAMGIAVKDSEGNMRPTADLLNEVADRFKGWSDGANKASIASELFSTRNARFITMLNAGSDGLRQQGEELERIGGVITPEMAKRAEEFNDSITTLKVSLSGLANSILGEALPRMTDFVKQLTDGVTKGNQWQHDLGLLKDTFEGIGKVIAAVGVSVVNLADGFATLSRVIGSLSVDPIESMALGTAKLFGVYDKWKAEGDKKRAARGEKPFEPNAGFQDAERELKALEQRMANRPTAFEIFSGGDTPQKPVIPAPAPAPPAAPKPDAPNIPTGKANANQQSKAEVADLREAYRTEQDRLSLERERLQVDFRLTDAQKRSKEIEMLREESVWIDKQVESLKTKRELTTDEAAKATIDREISSMADARRNLETRRAGLEGSPDPYSVGQQIESAITNLRNTFGTEAQMIARAFTSTIGSAVNAVQGGIRGLIDGTMTWGAALQNIGQNIMSGVIDAISRMFAEWVVGRALAGMAHIAWSAKEGAADVASKAPGALLASISSYGTAALVGAAALAAALAAFGTFREGGYTGDGAPNSPAGIVHGREFVMPESVTSQWGVGALEGIRSGAIRPEDLERSESAPVVNVPQPNVSVAYFDDPNKLRDWVESEMFAGRVVKVIRTRGHEAGVG